MPLGRRTQSQDLSCQFIRYTNPVAWLPGCLGRRVAVHWQAPKCLCHIRRTLHYLSPCYINAGPPTDLCLLSLPPPPHTPNRHNTHTLSHGPSARLAPLAFPKRVWQIIQTLTLRPCKHSSCIAPGTVPVGSNGHSHCIQDAIPRWTRRRLPSSAARIRQWEVLAGSSCRQQRKSTVVFSRARLD